MTIHLQRLGKTFNLVLLATLLVGLVSPDRPETEVRRGVVAGQVVDDATGESVEYVQILLEEADRSTTTDVTGAFTIGHLPAGLYTLKAYRVGYEPFIRNVDVPADDTLKVRLEMSASVIQAGELVVEGDRPEAMQLPDAVMQLEGRRLRQRLGTTIAETLDDEPGIAMRSMGPAPARPVLRGLGGERLLVLEDGLRTGDLSATSPDHALVVDPMTAERIEVIRGPSALVYGPNALGGVVNVVRRGIPTARPDRIRVDMGVQGQSVNTGVSGGGSIVAPLPGPLAVRVDGAIRSAGDVDTPVGELDNTELSTRNALVGIGMTEGWGRIGAAGSRYESSYGIPGGFVGAHPNGVSVELERSHLEGEGELLSVLPWMPRLEATGAYTRYFHQEFESSGALGIEYGVVSWHGAVTAHTSQSGPFRKGAFGVWAEVRDFAAGGFAFTPRSQERTIAGFAHQDVHLGALTVQGGVRYDLRRVQPEEERLSRTIGQIRSRDFSGLSASATLLWHPGASLTLGATAMRSLRMPGIEELFSEGPHLAAYSYEVGNPDLDSERGLGLELFAQYQAQKSRASIAVYRNAISNYIFPLNTGALNYRVYLPVYQFTGAQAVMWGGEAQAEAKLNGLFTITGSASYVRGTLDDLGLPIPWTPPLQGEAGARYHVGHLSVSAGLRLAAEQDRVGPFEEPTDGYAVVDVFAQYYFTRGGVLSTIDLGIENVTGTAYRDHLSRVKSIMPEPGRNVKLLYRIYL